MRFMVVFSFERYSTISWLASCVMVVAAVGVSHRRSPTSQNIQLVFTLTQNVSAPGLDLDSKGH